MSSFLRLQLFAPPLTAGDERSIRALSALEAELAVTVNEHLGDRFEFLDDGARKALLSSAAAKGDIPLLASGDSERHVSINGLEKPAELSPGGQALLHAVVATPHFAPFIDRAFGMVGAVGLALDAFWGYVTTDGSRMGIGSQTVHPTSRRGPELGLPALKPSKALASPAIPHSIGWINYWSAKTAALTGFPASDLPLARVSELANGAWVWQLTPEPLDLSRNEHLALLIRAYERFPPVGGRAGN